ncbi:MAG TPA: MBOAT family protein [Gammaproteobacteria bacterium]|nr:MBOAT family protein [Gammaproteobacteria bacterium]
MLFNSLTFIFLFLPITLIGYYLVGGRGHHNLAIGWLVGASLFFYGFWNTEYLILILSSILFNYSIGLLIHGTYSKHWLFMGVASNLALLGYYKYANFSVDNANAVFDAGLSLEHIAFPLAISFFTFQQIAYLVDTYKGKTREINYLHYCLFVTFFPQLIAGPIVHHKEMLPQFAKDAIYKLNYGHLAVGLTIFALGLFKKVVLADNIAPYAIPVFDAAERGIDLTFWEAWYGAFAYTFQIYFDFSGYSDMAIGLARLFGIRLPLNFNSPYKSASIIEFWRRWHMTLSRFLRDYLYIPLGGSRKGDVRRYTNLMLTMLLGGLWHGAGWTFLAWGALHGFYLTVNHIWREFGRQLGHVTPGLSAIGTHVSRMITLASVVVAWGFFRAETFQGGWNILAAMAGGNGVSLPHSLEYLARDYAGLLSVLSIRFDGAFHNTQLDGSSGFVFLVVLLWIVLYAPNTQEIMRNYKPAFEVYREKITKFPESRLCWKPSVVSAVLISSVFIYSIYTQMTADYVEFIYWFF